MEHDLYLFGPGHYMGIGDDIAVLSEHHTAAGGAVAPVGGSLNGYGGQDGPVVNLCVRQNCAPGGLELHRHSCAGLGPGNGGGRVVQLLVAGQLLPHGGEIVQVPAPHDGPVHKIPLQQGSGQADYHNQRQQPRKPGPFPPSPPGPQHRPDCPLRYLDGGGIGQRAVRPLPGAALPQAVILIIHRGTSHFIKNSLPEGDKCYASVSVKWNWVTPSSLVTVMLSFRLPRIVFTIYNPRPTPSRSIERE